MNGQTVKENNRKREGARFLSVKAAAERLGVHESFLYRRIGEGTLRAVRLSARRYAVPESELEQFVAARLTGAGRA